MTCTLQLVPKTSEAEPATTTTPVPSTAALVVNSSVAVPLALRMAPTVAVLVKISVELADTDRMAPALDWLSKTSDALADMSVVRLTLPDVVKTRPDAPATD
jgi:hypothetical protein